MAFTQNMEKAARRHLRAAQVLYDHVGPGDQPGCMAVAGYLFGLAGELAVKEIMRNSGMVPISATYRREEAFFAHFPILKTLLATATGRRAGQLRQLSEDPQLFQNWDVAMRYAPTTEIRPTWIAAWKDSAEKLVNRMAVA